MSPAMAVQFCQTTSDQRFRAGRGWPAAAYCLGEWLLRAMMVLSAPLVRGYVSGWVSVVDLRHSRIKHGIKDLMLCFGDE